MSGSKSPTPSSGLRKVSIGKQSPIAETSYAFLNFSHPAEAKDQKARRTVRSHVTRQQHQKEQLAAAAGRRSSSVPQSLEPNQQIHPAGRPHAASSPQTHSGAGLDQQSPASLGSNSTSPGNSVSSSPLSPRVSLDPAQLYPANWIPYINVVLDCYVNSTAHDILNAQDLFTVGALRTTWMQFVFMDVALLHATILVGTSFFGSSTGQRSHPTIDILQLKGMTISAINEAIQDPVRSASDQVLAAVLSMAQYEAFWGEAQAFAVHMGAVRNMIQIRGGLGAIGSSLQGLLERMVLSLDHHTSRATGTPISFDPSQFPSSLAHPALTVQRSSEISSTEEPR